MKVDIPFKPRFWKAMLDGTKTMTSRTRNMGEIGDTFEAFGTIFQITKVYPELLNFVALRWKEEGAESYEDFKKIWISIHPIRGFDPIQSVWVHEFKRLEVFG